MVKIYFVVVPKTLYWLKHIKIFETVKKSNDKIVQKKFQNMTINLLRYILRVHTLIFLASFFIHFVVELLQILWIGKGWHCFYVSLLRRWYKWTKKEYRHLRIIQYKVCVKKSSLKIVWKTNNFFIKRNIAFLF